MTANSSSTEKKKGRRPTKPFVKGYDARRNYAGRPPLGESWREIFDKAGKLTKRELLDLYPVFGKRLVGLPEDVSLRDAVALAALTTLACEPSPGLLSAIMERVDGKVTQPLSVDWREDAKQNGIDPERVLAIVDAAIERGFSGGGGDAPDDESADKPA